MTALLSPASRRVASTVGRAAHDVAVRRLRASYDALPAGAQEEYRPDGAGQSDAGQNRTEQDHAGQSHPAGAAATGTVTAGADLPGCHE